MLKQETLARMIEQPAIVDNEGTATYGIGWSMRTAYGLRQVGHSGGMAGVSTQLSM